MFKPNDEVWQSIFGYGIVEQVIDTTRGFIYRVDFVDMDIQAQIPEKDLVKFDPKIHKRKVLRILPKAKRS